MPTTSTVDLSKSAIHQLEAQALGVRTPAAGTNALTGNLSRVISTTVTATIPTAAVSITGVVTATVTGVKLGDIVECAQQGAVIAGVGAYGAYVSATDTITLWAIATTGGYTGASKVYNIIVKPQS